MARRVTAILLACCVGLSAAAQDRPTPATPAPDTPVTAKPAPDKPMTAKPAPDKLATGQTTLRIATEGAFPPFNYLDAGSEPHGFEIEIGKALCQEMAVACTFVVHEWDGIIRGLLAKDYDAIMASLAITPRRKARIAFSKRYYFIPPAFIGPKDSDIHDVTPAALAGKRIGTTENSHHAAFLEARYADADIRVYGKLDEANLDLLTGRIDLVLGDKLALSRFLEAREGACCRFVADAPADQEFYGEGVGIGLRKEDKDLKDRFNRALERLTADGTYDRIRSKYFAFDTK
ncbi:MAG TPA: transporter substrate-binding domain-containing protein [Beijerinckiaceae bacterium]|jgi:polar amino acid transport system substrate-binding protein